MPRQVDHPKRRADIVDAVWRLIVRHGLEAVTMRHVAAEAGVSLGQVQHYFASKDELLMLALERVSEELGARIGACIAESAESGPRSLVRAVLVEMLPLDEQRRTEAHVAFAFLARAAVVPALAEVLRAGYDQFRDFLTEQIEVGQRLGQVAADRDARREAVALLAMLDGLTAHALVEHHSPAEARLALELHLNDLFGAAC
ncbi:TetR/AcrR family transcriptional regulator [Saccharopolyspora sp. 5N708]|uniref:TetR/AcrR family transcriptional regulator n=1 Tax=Saccharopolyspora sp. 5N708 TaxID=3457424 RepID=UPI003FD3B757